MAGGEVRLADVAETADLPDEAAQVVVARLPQPGAALRLRLAQVETELVGAGINVAQVRFSGAAWCDVRRSDGAPRVCLPTDSPPRACWHCDQPRRQRPPKTPCRLHSPLHGLLTSLAPRARRASHPPTVQAAVMAQLGLTDARDLKLELDRAARHWRRPPRPVR